MWVDNVTDVDLCKFDLSDSIVSENLFKSYISHWQICITACDDLP